VAVVEAKAVQLAVAVLVEGLVVCALCHQYQQLWVLHILLL
jgi:hypothetical protein